MTFWERLEEAKKKAREEDSRPGLNADNRPTRNLSNELQQTATQTRPTIVLPTAAQTIQNGALNNMNTILSSSKRNAPNTRTIDELRAEMEEARQIANEMSRMESDGMRDFQSLQTPGSERYKQYRNAGEARRAYENARNAYDQALISSQNNRVNAAQNAVTASGDYTSAIRNGASASIPSKYKNLKDVVSYITDWEDYDFNDWRDRVEFGMDHGQNFRQGAYNVDMMTQQEKDTVLYYVGKGEYEKASDYLDDLERTLNQRANSGVQEQTAQQAESHPILGTIAGIASWPLNIPAAFDTVAQAIRQGVTGEYMPADPNRDSYALSKAASGLTQGVSEAAGKGATELTGSERAGNIARFLAGAGLSIGQNVTQIASLGPAALPAMALSASGQGATSAVERGGSYGQAALVGVANGVVEALTEKIPLDNLFRMASAGKQTAAETVKNILRQMGTEATEESISEIANNVVDIAVMGNNSEYRQYVNQLVQSGVPQAEAEKQAFVQFFILNTAQAAAGGALSGGLMGGGASALNTIRNRVTLPTAGQNGVLPTANQTTVDTTQPTVEATRPTVETAQPTVERDNVMSTTREQIRNDLSTRKDFRQYTDQAMQNNSQETLGEMFQSGEVGVDAGNNLFLRDPEDHIDQRSMGYVGSRNVNAFQFDNPALHGFFADAAQELINDVVNTTPGERWSYEAMAPDGTHYTQWNGTKRATTAQIAELLDDQHMSYDQIVDAAQKIINDQGQENKAAAKRVELILDDMLTNGWRDMTGYYHEPNQDYIRMKREIPGAYIPEETADYDRLADIDPLPEGVTLESEVPPVVQRLSQALGRNIQMYDGSRESGTRGTANGYYADGTIYVNSQTANPIAQVIAHELTHSVEMADAYQDLQNLIFERIQQTGGNLDQMRAQKADLYQRNGVNLNAQDLDAEIVAEYVEKNLLTDEASIQELTRTNRTLAQRIRDWIYSILAKLGNTDAQIRVFLERARDAYSRALQQTQGTVDTVATADTVGSVASQRQVQSLLDQYDSGAITQEQLIEQAARLMEQEVGGQYSISEITDPNELESRIYALREEIQDAEDEALFYMPDDPSSEARQLRNRIVKLQHELDDLTEQERRAAVRTPLTTILDNLGRYRRSDLESLAEQVSNGAWDDYESLSRADLEDGLREILQDRMGEMNPLEAQLSRSGFYVRPAGENRVQYSISEQTDQEKQSHAKAVLDYFGKTYNWNETGYITQDGSRVDLSGKHEGGPGGYRTVDHRDISDALGEDYGDGDYSGAMVQFISEGNIRISPESGGIDLSVQPTRAQEQALADFISRNRGEVILDIDRPNGDTVASVEYPRGTHSTKVINDIRNYFSDGTIPQVSEVSRFRYSLDENQRNQFVSMLREYARGNWNEQTIQEYLNLVRQNGEYDQGANAARPVLVPQRDSEGNPVSRTARTAMGAKAIPESVASDIANLVRTGQMSYERVGDKASTQRAIQRIQNDGFDRSLEYFSQNVRKGIASKDMVTLGQQLLVNAANAGDGRRTAEILQLYTQMGTSIGQAEQAFSILRKLDPSDQLYAIQKTVSNLEEEIQKRFKDKNITIDPALLEEFQNQTDDAGRDAVKEKIYQNVADQIPSNWRDKWNAWRYMAMLVNPRTHIRNVAGNLLFQPVRMVKDKVAATMETFVHAINPNFEKTKSFVANPDLYRAAWSDFKNVKDILSGNKYDDIRSEINSRRTVFGGVLGKPFEAVRTGNSWALEAEDIIFKRLTYADALSGYLQSRGVTGEQLRSGNVDSNLLSAARDYAGQEALKATYQDKNQFSDLLSRRFQENNTAGKVANAAIDAVLPFRRTPANILVRGFEYSPLGLAKSLTADLVQVKRGNMSGAQAIDNIAAGLTGSGLFALGAMLLAQGIVTSGGDESEEQNDLNDLTGKQNYALNLPGGGSVTLDWLAPESLPFFMGVEFMDALGEGGSVMETITSALTSISEPMLELSMLQSLNDLIDSVSFAESSGKLVSMAGSALISYLTQAIPTLGGQIERTTEENRMSSFTDRNNPLPRDIQYALSRASARLPGDYQQVPYIDAWGRTESNGNPLTRALNNFLNPAYTSQINETAADREIQRLLDAGMTGVVPDRTTQSQKVDGAYLSPEQYVEYATLKGQTSYDVVSEMIESELYQNMTDEEKADAIKRAYQYAGHVAAQAINPEHESESYVSGAQNAQDDFGLSEAEYLLMDRVYGKSGLDRIKETMDSGVSMDTAIEVNNALDALEPKSGEDSVSNLQRYRAVVDNVSSVNQQLSVLKTVSTDSDYRKFVVGNNFGVSPGSYVTAREAMSRFDQPNSSGNLGTYTQAEIEAMLDSFPSSATLTGSGTMTLTNSQKAVLWQLISGSSSPKNNPYSYSIGQQVIDAVNEAKQSNNQGTTQTSQYSGLLNFLPGG